MPARRTLIKIYCIAQKNISITDLHEKNIMSNQKLH